jgi:hypothetical protein
VTAIAVQAAPMQNPDAVWQVVPDRQVVPPSLEQRWWQVPPAMQAWPEGQGVLSLQAPPDPEPEPQPTPEMASAIQKPSALGMVFSQATPGPDR